MRLEAMSQRMPALLAALALAAAVLAAGSAPAQQTCYSYDGLGQFVRVVNQQGQTIIYEYDAVGNILAILISDKEGACITGRGKQP